MVHNHGPDEGLGTLCPEKRMLDGSLKGACLLPLDKCVQPCHCLCHEGMGDAEHPGEKCPGKTGEDFPEWIVVFEKEKGFDK